MVEAANVYGIPTLEPSANGVAMDIRQLSEPDVVAEPLPENDTRRFCNVPALEALMKIDAPGAPNCGPPTRGLPIAP